MMRAIQCKYSCNQCGINRKVITVTGRLPGEEAVDFVRRVSKTACMDHDNTSRDCRITKLSELMIPMSDEGRVGDVTIDMKGKHL